MGTEPTIEDISLVCISRIGANEVRRHLLKLCSLCLGHMIYQLTEVTVGSGGDGRTNTVLSSIIGELQGFLLRSDRDWEISYSRRISFILSRFF